MAATHLHYLHDMGQLSCKAHVVHVTKDDEMYSVVLNETVFYPQGGGQPSDLGTMQSDRALFNVLHVSIEDGVVYHKGTFKEAPFTKGDKVELNVDASLRALHSRIHTAGHVIDYALSNLGYSLISGKGYHFPQGPYVEYRGTLEQSERDALVPRLEQAANSLVKAELKTSIKFIDNDLKRRSLVIDNFPPFLCGGTHVLTTKDIGHILIRKIKNDKGNIRVSYAITE